MNKLGNNDYNMAKKRLGDIYYFMSDFKRALSHYKSYANSVKDLDEVNEVNKKLKIIIEKLDERKRSSANL